ncbi:hypothetical protein BGP_6507 [Beggiatoa sp. PS]|nr:hypothetical protein BGP_6507 [Beggiatoa sp. PS]
MFSTCGIGYCQINDTRLIAFQFSLSGHLQLSQIALKFTGPHLGFLLHFGQNLETKFFNAMENFFLLFVSRNIIFNFGPH